MKFSILINQLAVFNAGLADDTDLNDWAIVDYIQSWINHPKAQRMGDKVWLNYKHLIKNMPILSFKTKGAVSARINKLKDFGVIDTEQDDVGRLFVSISELGHSIISFHEGSAEIVPVQQNKQAIQSNEQGVQSNEQGVQQNELILNNQALNHQSKPSDKGADGSKNGKSTETWNAYSRAYLNRYSVSPLRNAKVSKLLCSLVDHVGSDNAPHVASYYVSLNDQWYIKKGHDVATLVQNAQAVYTQWANGTNHTSQQARETERRSHMQSVGESLIAKINRGEL